MDLGSKNTVLGKGTKIGTISMKQVRKKKIQEIEIKIKI